MQEQEEARENKDNCGLVRWPKRNLRQGQAPRTVITPGNKALVPPPALEFN